MAHWYKYDITFCIGEGDGRVCPRRDRCHRYLSEERKAQSAADNCPYLSIMSPADVDKCGMFWDDSCPCC